MPTLQPLARVARWPGVCRALMLVGMLCGSSISALANEADCVQAVQGLAELLVEIEEAASNEAVFHSRMLEMRERIGGQDGAALDSRASLHLDEMADWLASLLKLVTQTNESVVRICSEG